MTAPAAPRTAVRVYSPSGAPCYKCRQTKTLLDRLGIEYVELDIDAPEAQNLISEHGFQAAPVVDTGTEVWSDFRFDKIKGLAS